MDKTKKILIRVASFSVIGVSISIGSIFINKNFNIFKKDQSQKVELWNGIKAGIKIEKLKKNLGGDTSCNQVTDWFDKPIDGEFICWRKYPKVSVGNEKGEVGVSIKNNIVKEIWITFNLQSRCLEKNETPSYGDQKSPCFIGLERRISKSIENAKKILSAKYGEIVQVPSLFNDDKIYYGWISDGKIIRIRRPDLGVWSIFYSVNESPL